MPPTAAMLILCRHHNHHQTTSQFQSEPDGDSWLKQLFSGWVHVSRLAWAPLKSPPEADRLEKRFKEAIEKGSW